MHWLILFRLSYFYSRTRYLARYTILTEITWLKKRDCFTTGKRDYIFLILPRVALTIIVLVSTYSQRPMVKDINALFVSVFGERFFNFSNVMIFVAFFPALAFVMFKDWLYKLIFIFLSLFIGYAIQNSAPFLIFFAVFLPTIIHVFLFTGFFIVLGALKNRSVTGIASAVVFILCAVIFLYGDPFLIFTT